MIDQKHSKQFDKIYNETYEDILKYVVCNCSNISDVNDIIQETYIEFYKILNRKEIEEINIKAFIKGIAKNKLKKYYSIIYKIKTISLFDKTKDDIEIIETIESDFKLEEYIIKEDLSDKICEYIKTKKLIISKIFFLYYYSNNTIKEIADELKVNESYVKNCLYRTLKELKDTFGKDSDKYE